MTLTGWNSREKYMKRHIQRQMAEFCLVYTWLRVDVNQNRKKLESGVRPWHENRKRVCLAMSGLCHGLNCSGCRLWEQPGGAGSARQPWIWVVDYGQAH